MKWLTRSIVPSMAALAALVAFFPRTGPEIKLQVVDFRFAPAAITVHVGDSIQVQNRGKRTHTFTCRRCGVDSGNVQPGQEAVVRFVKAGVFPYVCVYHQEQGMAGSLIVLKPGQTAPPRPTGVPLPADLPPGLPPGLTLPSDLPLAPPEGPTPS